MTQPEVLFRPYDKSKDGSKLADWISKDTVHRARYGDNFDSDEGVELYVATADGQDILFLRLSRVVRIEVQFPPKEEAGRIKVARALRKGLYRIAAMFKHSGFSEIVFESDSNNLVNYMKGLGFVQSDYLTVPLVKR